MHRVIAGLILGLALITQAAAQTSAPPADQTPPTPVAPAPGATTPPAAPPPAAHEFLYEGEATSILGRPVTGTDGHQIGAVVDVLVDESGQPRAAVIDFGGFLGIGTRRVAIVWRALKFTPAPAGGTISVNLTVDQLRATPEFKAATRPVTMAAPPTPEPSASPAATSPANPPSANPPASAPPIAPPQTAPAQTAAPLSATPPPSVPASPPTAPKP